MGQAPFLPGGPQVRDHPVLAENLPEKHGAGLYRRRWGFCLFFLGGRHVIANFSVENQSFIIPLNPPLEKGDFFYPPFLKVGRGDYEEYQFKDFDYFLK
jgi:hypothetical protein